MGKEKINIFWEKAMLDSPEITNAELQGKENRRYFGMIKYMIFYTKEGKRQTAYFYKNEAKLIAKDMEKRGLKDPFVSDSKTFGKILFKYQ